MTANKKIRFAVLVVAVTVAVGLAQQPSYAQDQTQPVANQQSPESRQQLIQRLEDRKANRQVNLTSAQANRLRQRCSVAQAKLVPYQAQVGEFHQSHDQAYATVVERLQRVISYVDTQADTQPLQTATTDLEAKINGFKAQSAAYEQLISDLVTQECSNDPVAFQASLEAAREARQNLVTLKVDIRTYLDDNVKPLIESLKKALMVK